MSPFYRLRKGEGGVTKTYPHCALMFGRFTSRCLNTLRRFTKRIIIPTSFALGTARVFLPIAKTNPSVDKKENQTKKENDTISFPDKESLSKCYCHNMKDKYLAEKTTKTITEWLAGQSVNKLSVGNVAMYAVSDFQEYLGQSGSESLIISDIFKTNRGSNCEMHS